MLFCNESNGALLTPAKARALKDAGLRRITISLDSLDDAVFMAMNDVGFPVAKVLAAIEAAADAGLAPIKINMVVKRGVNEESILDMARYFRGSGHILRFIEYMDVGTTNGWRMADVVPAAAIVERISAVWRLAPVDPNYSGEVANRWRYVDGGGEIGVIASVTQPFCRACTRARLSAEGRLYTCLFASQSHDLRALLQGGASDADITACLSSVWPALIATRRSAPRTPGPLRKWRCRTSAVRRASSRQRWSPDAYAQACCEGPDRCCMRARSSR